MTIHSHLCMSLFARKVKTHKNRSQFVHFASDFSQVRLLKKIRVNGTKKLITGVNTVQLYSYMCILSWVGNCTQTSTACIIPQSDQTAGLDCTGPTHSRKRESQLLVDQQEKESHVLDLLRSSTLCLWVNVQLPLRDQGCSPLAAVVVHC